MEYFGSIRTWKLTPPYRGGTAGIFTRFPHDNICHRICFIKNRFQNNHSDCYALALAKKRLMTKSNPHTRTKLYPIVETSVLRKKGIAKV